MRRRAIAAERRVTMGAMSDVPANASPYRAVKPPAPADLVVALREAGSDGYGGMIVTLFAGGAVAWMSITREWWVAAAVAVLVAIALTWRAIRRMPPRRATFSVRSGELVVNVRGRTLRAALDDVLDVRVSARVLQSNTNRNIPAYVAPMTALAAQQVDRSVGVLEVVLADPQPAWRPTDEDERSSHLDEVARSIRLHLRKHGWKPPSEREA